jgi:hypothetical protein
VNSAIQGKKERLMADTITVVCPKCKKQLKGPPEVQGKKVRCKACGENFTAQALAAAKPAAPPGKAAPAKSRRPAGAPAKSKPTPPAAAKPPGPESSIALKPLDSVRAQPGQPATPATEPEPEHHAAPELPYQLTDEMKGVKRCPQCAFEMDEEAIICLECGFNTETRSRIPTRKTIDITAGDRLMWKLPGLLCAVAFFTLVGIASFLWFLPDEEWYGHFSVKLWGSIICAGFAWLTGLYAFKRLILHPHPPEVERG